MTCKKWKQFFLGLFWLDLFQFVVLLFPHFVQDDQQKCEQLVCLTLKNEIKKINLANDLTWAPRVQNMRKICPPSKNIQTEIT